MGFFLASTLKIPDNSAQYLKPNRYKNLLPPKAAVVQLPTPSGQVPIQIRDPRWRRETGILRHSTPVAGGGPGFDHRFGVGSI